MDRQNKLQEEQKAMAEALKNMQKKFNEEKSILFTEKNEYLQTPIASFFIVSPPNATRPCLSQHCYPLSTVAHARLHWNGLFLQIAPLNLSCCESVWPSTTSLETQIGISKLALSCASVWPWLYRGNVAKSPCHFLFVMAVLGLTLQYNFLAFCWICGLVVPPPVPK